MMFRWYFCSYGVFSSLSQLVSGHHSLSSPLFFSVFLPVIANIHRPTPHLPFTIHHRSQPPITTTPKGAGPHRRRAQAPKGKLRSFQISWKHRHRRPPLPRPLATTAAINTATAVSRRCRSSSTPSTPSTSTPSWMWGQPLVGLCQRGRLPSRAFSQGRTSAETQLRPQGSNCCCVEGLGVG